LKTKKFKELVHVAVKKWRCLVCGYIHEGEAPPEVCPVCGVGPEEFVLVEEKERDVTLSEEIKVACRSISHGMYIICSKNGERFNGQTANSLTQVSGNPIQVAIGINKGNLTHEYIEKSGVFVANILGCDSIDLAKHFGFQTGREVDKFKDISYELGAETAAPYIKEALAYLECKIDQKKTLDANTHTVYLAEVVGGGILNKGEPMTYSYYHANRK
jgi:flavin reductase (DIM6/NTAB) family NADH-FMN oxidoreductase RutF/rubredoxin